MNERTVFYVIPASLKDNMNLVCAAMGLGPATFSVPVSADGSEPATHFCGNDNGMTAEQAAVFSAFPDDGGTLPPIDGTWGENDVISQALATEACAAAVVSVGSNMTGLQNMAATLGALGLVEVQLEL